MNYILPFNYKAPASKKITNDLEKAVKERVKEVRYHFKNDKWDITSDYIVNDVLEAVFKTELLGFVRQQLLKEAKIKGLNLVFKDTGFGPEWLFCLDKKKKAKKKK